jgi:hypothetical protein
MPDIGRKLIAQCHLLLLVGAICLGGWLRFSRLDLMEFKDDEWQLHHLATRQAQGHWQKCGLMSSVGVHNPPMAVYLFALPALVSRDPLFMAGFPALLGTAAIGLTYLLARRWVSKWAALCAAVLFAVSPWAVLLSRKIWAQDLLPFFTLCFLLAAVAWLREGRLRHALFMAASLAVLNQVHYSSLALWPIAVFLAWRRPSRKSLHQLGLGAVIFIVAWIPFGLFLGRHGMAELKRQHLGEPATRYLAKVGTALQWQAQYMGHGGFSYATGPTESDFAQAAHPDRWTEWAFVTILAAGFVATVLRARREEDLWLLVLWFLLPPLLLSVLVINPHYMVICFPTAFVMVGLLMDEIAELVTRRFPRFAERAALSGLAAALLVLICAEQIVFLCRFNQYLAARGGTLGDYGLTYRQKLMVARYMRETAPEGIIQIRDCSHCVPSESTYYYLYARSGGQAQLVPARTRRPAPGENLFILQDPWGAIEHGMHEAPGIEQRVGNVRVFWSSGAAVARYRNALKIKPD